MRPGYGELDALVLPYRAAEDLALCSAAGRPIHEPAPVADALGGYKDALGVHPVQDVTEAPAFLADQALGGMLEVLEEELVGLVVDHHPPRLDC